MLRFVTCVLKSGGDFTPHHVRLLSKMVRHNLKVPYRLVLLTDIWNRDVLGSADIVVPLEHDWDGWWSKLELFRPDMPWCVEDSVTLYLDLDTVIMDDLFPFFNFAQDMMVLERFRWPDEWATGVMAWKGPPSSLPYFVFNKDENMAIRECRNDQRFLMRTLKPKADSSGLSIGFWQKEFPGRFTSYKRHVEGNGGPGKGVSVVCFHGKPRPWVVDEAWVKEIYR